MKSLRALAALLLLAACGSVGPPPPDWKTDSADLVARYQKYALLGENTLAERYFQQAVAATGGAGRVAETAHLWLVRCGIRRAMLIDDTCTEYAELARMAPSATDQAYYRFITLRWEDLDPALLPLSIGTCCVPRPAGVLKHSTRSPIRWRACSMPACWSCARRPMPPHWSSPPKRPPPRDGASHC